MAAQRPVVSTRLSPNPATGNTTADGTEQTLASIGTGVAGIFMLSISLANLADGDTIELRAYTEDNNGTELQLDYRSFSDGGKGILQFGTHPCLDAIKYTLKQTAGTNRAYRWQVVDFTGN